MLLQPTSHSAVNQSRVPCTGGGTHVCGRGCGGASTSSGGGGHAPPHAPAGHATATHARGCACVAAHAAGTCHAAVRVHAGAADAARFVSLLLHAVGCDAVVSTYC